MWTYIGFILAVTAYATFLLWCLGPIFKRPKWRKLGWLRVTAGLLLIAANLSPLFGLPILVLISAYSSHAADRFMAVMLFPRTLPTYMLNVRDRARTAALVVEIAYPISIGGVRYEPLVRTACTVRRIVNVDRIESIRVTEDFRTASGGEFAAQSASGIVALHQSNELCGMAKKGQLQPGPFPDWRNRVGPAPSVHVVRGEADETRLYRLYYYADAITVDDIVLHPPQVVRIERAPAIDLISSGALWPMRIPEDSSLNTPAIIQAYGRLPSRARSCIQTVTVSMNFKTLAPTTERPHRHALDVIPAPQRAAVCRDALARHAPQAPRSRLTPVEE
jgi:hypothetical protein